MKSLKNYYHQKINLEQIKTFGQRRQIVLEAIKKRKEMSKKDK